MSPKTASSRALNQQIASKGHVWGLQHTSCFSAHLWKHTHPALHPALHILQYIANTIVRLHDDTFYHEKDCFQTCCLEHFQNLMKLFKINNCIYMSVCASGVSICELILERPIVFIWWSLMEMRVIRSLTVCRTNIIIKMRFNYNTTSVLKKMIPLNAGHNNNKCKQ